MSLEGRYYRTSGSRPSQVADDGASMDIREDRCVNGRSATHLGSSRTSNSQPPRQQSPQQSRQQPQQQPVQGQQSGYDRRLLYKKLPYVKRQMDFGTWIYRNRYGVAVTVLCYIIAMFSIANVRFDITMMEHIEGFFVDLPEEPKPEPEPEEPKPKEPEITNEQIFDDVKNVAVNEDAKLDGGLKDDKGTQASDIYKEAQELQDRLAASKAAYDQASADDEAYLNELRQSLQRQGNNESVREDSKVSGNVTISWSLDGRSAVYIHNPAYRCPGAGSVTIAITVDRNGKVIGAEVSKISRSNDNCLIDMAIDAARQTRFNVSASAPEKQTGSITYIFMAQ